MMNTKIILRRLFSKIIYSIKDSILIRKIASRSLGVQSTRIEINGACNAKCTFCHSGNINYNKNKLMSPEMFEKVLNHLKKEQLLTKYIWLYDRGEPFLHPEFGKILDICKSYNVKARLSTNASKVPDLTKEQWSTICMLKVSLSGIHQTSYGKIHGLNIKTIMKNVEIIIKQLSLMCYAQLSWHRYQFNHTEEQEARIWAEKLGFIFDAINAEIIEVEKLIGLSDKTLTLNEMEEINDLILVEQSPLLTRLMSDTPKTNEQALKNSHFSCTQFDQVSVNYDCESLKCCLLSPDSEENRQGNILYQNADEIKRNNYSHMNTCSRCVELEIPQPSNDEYKRIWGDI